MMNWSRKLRKISSPSLFFEKLKGLLIIVGKVQQSGKNVTVEDVEYARSLGVTDLDIHDTVLIVVNFCMMNRYVDGLVAWILSDSDFYRQRAILLVAHGYLGSAKRR